MERLKAFKSTGVAGRPSGAAEAGHQRHPVLPLNCSSKAECPSPWTAPAHRSTLQTNRLQPTRDLDTEVKSPSNQVPVTLFCPVTSTTGILFKRRCKVPSPSTVPFCQGGRLLSDIRNKQGTEE